MEMNPDDLFDKLRQEMVAGIVAHAVFASGETGKAALSARVLEVIGQVPRHEFVPAEIQAYAYADTPLPIGFNKTISQPYIVALMTDLLDPRAEDTVLEIGTGLGYQAALLSALVRHVYSVEIIDELARQAKKRLPPPAAGAPTLPPGDPRHTRRRRDRPAAPSGRQASTAEAAAAVSARARP